MGETSDTVRTFWMRSLLLLGVALDFYWSSTMREDAEAVEIHGGLENRVSLCSTSLPLSFACPSVTLRVDQVPICTRRRKQAVRRRRRLVKADIWSDLWQGSPSAPPTIFPSLLTPLMSNGPPPPCVLFLFNAQGGISIGNKRGSIC